MRQTSVFPANVKPVHVGVYYVWYRDSLEGYCYWSGKEWGSMSPTPRGAESNWRAMGASGSLQDKEWCGLTRKSK